MISGLQQAVFGVLYFLLGWLGPGIQASRQTQTQTYEDHKFLFGPYFSANRSDLSTVPITISFCYQFFFAEPQSPAHQPSPSQLTKWAGYGVTCFRQVSLSLILMALVGVGPSVGLYLSNSAHPKYASAQPNSTRLMNTPVAHCSSNVAPVQQRIACALGALGALCSSHNVWSKSLGTNC